MNRNVLRNAFGLVLTAFVSGAASGQCIVNQPWDLTHASHTSIVRTCGLPTPAPLVAADDFKCRAGGTLTHVRWWGTLALTAQVGRPYYIAIRRDNGNCQPSDVLWSACVTPQAVSVGADCQGRRVFRFTAAVPPFAVVAGQKYWIQISEIDDRSARPGVEDFRWSGRQPLRLCPAAQINGAGGILQPLIDPCDGAPDDLSFVLKIV